MAEWIKKNKIQWYTYCLQETHFSLKHTHRWRVKGRKNISSKWWSKKCRSGDLPGGPVVKNPSCSAGNTSSIPGRRSQFPDQRQLSPLATTREPMCHNYRAHTLWSLVPQLERSLWATTREKPVHRNERSRMQQQRPNAAKNKINKINKFIKKYMYN